MKRRTFVKGIVLTPFIPTLSVPENYGWVPPKNDDTPDFPAQLVLKRQSILLYKFLEVATKRFLVPHDQETVDCTSHAVGLAIDIKQAIQVCLERERWVKKIATELLHIGGREIIGGRTSGGVSVSASVKFASDYGNIYRTRYADWDFTEYSLSNVYQVDRAKDLSLLLKEASHHKILESYKVKNSEQACIGMSNLCPIVIGSGTKFSKKRDRQGFIQPVRGSWSHAWSVIGFDTKFSRPGILLMSSWGPDWVTGPKRNQPDGSAWVDLDVFDRMIGEGIAIKSFKGLK